MCKSNISAKKFFKILFQVMFYRIIIYWIFILTGYEVISLKGVIKSLIPITSIGTNFTSCFLMFYLTIPFLNILIKNINEKKHLYLIALSSFIYILMGTIPKFNVTMNYVSWFIVLYFISSYIRIYPKQIYSNRLFWSWMTFISLIISALSVVISTWIGTKIGINAPYYFVADSNTFLAVITGISLFMLFKNINLKYSSFINTIAASTFGVLLIHANSDTMRKWLWRDTFNNMGVYYTNYMVIHAIGSVLLIYIICTLIDFLRIYFLESKIFKLWDNKWETTLSCFKRLESKFLRKFNIN